jgi:hypothetical protein
MRKDRTKLQINRQLRRRPLLDQIRPHGLAFDEFGRRPWHADYKKTDQGNDNERKLYGFQGEFARLFGPKRRGRSESFGGRIKEIDSEEFHQYHLNLEKKYRPTRLRPRRDARAH